MQKKKKKKTFSAVKVFPFGKKRGHHLHRPARERTTILNRSLDPPLQTCSLNGAGPIPRFAPKATIVKVRQPPKLPLRGHGERVGKCFLTYHTVIMRLWHR
mmetsp:Transcript_73974/g.122092  ORF Transcript_73974/g.122092 Transcript_73974/m.122092 type:complete len:101 (-) Transcript_73974:1606-1908(-)